MASIPTLIRNPKDAVGRLRGGSPATPTGMRGAATQYAGAARGAASQYAGSARDWAGPRWENTRGRVSPVVGAARDRASAARDQMGPAWQSARTRGSAEVQARVAAATAAAAAALAPTREEAGRRSAAALAALRGELQLEPPPPPPAQRHPGRIVLAAAAAGGAGFGGWKAFSAIKAKRQTRGAGQGTPENRPDLDWKPATTVSTTTIGVTSDPAGAGPGEALTDATDERLTADRTPTTPDDPAVVAPIGEAGIDAGVTPRDQTRDETGNDTRRPF